MSPSQVSDDQHARREMTGPRLTPLKINKESHLIHKPSSSSSSSSSASSLANTAAASASKQQRHPVIIYTHSPKIIHTQARDFMALVQKLTGLSRSDEDPPAPHPQDHESGTILSEGSNGNGTRIRGREDAAAAAAASSSILTDENCSVGDVQVSSASSMAPPFDPAVNPFLSDVPLFTPSSSELFCSSRPMYRYPDPVFSSSNMSSISPSMMEVLKALTDY